MGYDERSAGALIFHESDSGRRYLLLRYPAGHWDFPKGNIEKGERPLDTMRREVREETGLVGIRPVEGFERTIEYSYNRGRNRRIRKQVVFFLAESSEDGVTISFEHQAYAWLPLQKAIDTVTYPNSKRLLIEADGALRSSGPSC